MLALAAIALGLWFWWDGLKVREHAQRIAVAACRDAGMQFLDGTVALKKIGVARDGYGRLRPLRSYGFEFSGTGTERRSGLVTLLGLRRQTLYMDLPDGPTIVDDGRCDATVTGAIVEFPVPGGANPAKPPGPPPAHTPSTAPDQHGTSSPTRSGDGSGDNEPR